MDILSFARNSVPFYYGFFETHKHTNCYEIQSFPVIDKHLVNQKYSDFISEKYKVFPYNRTIDIHTSGTTGECLTIKWDKKDYNKTMVYPSYFRKKFYNIHPLDRLLTFFTDLYINNNLTPMDHQYWFSNNYKVLSVSKSILQNEDRNTLEVIRTFDPNWIMTQPSTLTLFTDLLRKNDIRLNSLSYIECNGEHLHPSTQLIVQETLCVPITDNYGLNEFGYITFQCPLGHHHILKNNYVEIIKNEEENGTIVVSGLLNHAMPLIRYNTCDVGEIALLECPFFSGYSSVLNRLNGRKSKFIYLDDGKRMDPSFLSSIIDRINNNTNNSIRQYAVIQQSLFEFQVIIALNDRYSGWTDAIEKEFEDNLPNNYFKKCCKWSYSFVKKIPPNDKTGKVLYFDSKIGEY